MELSWSEFPDLTLLIRRLHSGDDAAAHQFFRVAYRHLRKLAARQLSREGSRDETSAEDLLHEVYLNRIRTWDAGLNVTDRSHYAALVCMALKDELCDRARRRSAQKRTAPAKERKSSRCAGSNLRVEEIMAIERELERLAKADPRAAQVVRLRYYGGCSWLETAHATGATVKAVRNDWDFAANWLGKRLGRSYF